jgi:diguanylate cyclase (GGDEF)-like protein
VQGRNADEAVEESEAVRQLNVLCDAGKALTSILEVGRLLPEITRRATELMGASGCDLYEYGPNGTTTTVVAWTRAGCSRADAGTAAGPSPPAGPGYTSLLDGGGIRSCHSGEAGLPAAVQEEMSRLGDEHVRSVPLRHGGRLIGGLVVRFGRHELPDGQLGDGLLESLAGVAAQAIHNARLFGRLEDQNRGLSGLLESTRAISSAVGLEDVLATVARTAATALQSTRCEIYEIDVEADAIVFLAEHTPGDAYAGEAIAPGQKFSLDDLPGDRAILQGGRPVVESASDTEVHPATREYMQRWGEKTYLSVPLVFADEVLGLLLFIESAAERVFTDEELDLACGLGEQAAVALRNARHVRQLQTASSALERQLRDRHELLRLSQTLLTTLDQKVVFDQIAVLLNALVGYDALDVATVRPETDELVIEFSKDSEDDRTLGFRLTLGEGVVGAVALSGVPEMVNDMTTDPRGVHVPGTIQRPQASILAPLKVGGVITGVLSIDRFGGAVFEDREFELVQLVTNLAAIALRNAQLYGEMQSQAATDALTGLLNRRGLDERLEDELTKARRWGSPVSVLMIDIDDFKPFNDQFGHLRGDMLLKRLSDVLRGSTRDRIDVVARYGGEEFVVVLPNTAPLGASSAADRLRANVAGGRRTAASVAESIRAAMAEEAMPRSGQTPVVVTVSAGVAGYPDHGETVERVLANADKALYLAKGLGKNRVEVFR